MHSNCQSLRGSLDFCRFAEHGALKDSPRRNSTPSRAASVIADQKAFVSSANIQTTGRILAEGGIELLQALQGYGFSDGLLVTADEKAGAEASPPASSLGNERSFRPWKGQLSSIPAYQGPFEGAILTSRIGSQEELHDVLLNVSFLLDPGGIICLPIPSYSEKYERESLERLIYNLPLRLVKADSQQVTLQVPPGYSFSRAPIEVEEEVVTGFGRGSKEMGTPTANLRPDTLFAGPLHDLPLGVYFGWAQVRGVEAPHNGPYKTVLNIGKRPSLEDGEQRTVELHVMHVYPTDFYGQQLKAVLLGFIRPEIRFPGLPALIRRINMDKGIAKSQLDLPMHSKHLETLISE